jgi:type I restriction enzyme S subunit
MFSGLKSYAEYKESGVPWLGPVPTGWPVKRVKALLGERLSKGFPAEPLLAATQSSGVVRKQDYESRTVTAQKELHLLKLVEVGDFVISLRSFQGGIELAHHRGIISPAYTVLYPRHWRDRDYLSLLFKSRGFINGLTICVTGIREGQNIDYQLLSRDRIPAPQREEQEAIAKFLAHADGRIYRAITAKRKMILLLEEQYRSFVSNSVTGSLDSAIPRTESGYPWIGDIPRHWNVLTCSRVVSLVTSGSRGWSDYYSDDGLIFIQSGNLGRSMELNLSRIQYVRPPQGAEGERTRVRRDDILVCITGALTGNVAFVNHDLDSPAFVNQHVALVRPKPQSVIPKFLALILHSEIGRSQFKIGEYGGTKQGLGLADVKSIIVPIPPMSEQQRILEDVAREKVRVASLRHRSEAEIELLREFRTRLTADVVTGQLDVREAAAKLPDLKPVDLATVDVDDSDDIDAVVEEFLDGDEP